MGRRKHRRNIPPRRSANLAKGHRAIGVGAVRSGAKVFGQRNRGKRGLRLRNKL